MEGTNLVMKSPIRRWPRSGELRLRPQERQKKCQAENEGGDLEGAVVGVQAELK